jgi:hypothetical protein
VPNRNFNIFTINNLTTRHCAKPRNVSRQFGGTQKNQLKKRKLKNRILLISLFLIVWSIVFDSPFQKGGIDHLFHYIIFSIFIIITFIYLSTIESFIVIEKILYSLLLSFFSLFASLLITERILENVYGLDYEMRQSNTISNLIFYNLTNVFIIISIILIRKIKQ